MLEPAVIDKVDAYWARHLGCTTAQLHAHEPVLLPHAAELADYAGAYMMQFKGAAPVISLPPVQAASLGPRLAVAARESLAADGRWGEILGTLLERMVGPAWVGYASAETLRHFTADVETRLLTPADAAHVERLGRACTADDWENVASLPRAGVSVGAFAEGELAAIAGYEIWGESIAHVAVLTHPAHRGRALGRAVVSAVAAVALERELVPQYRSLMANRASLAVAAALGFEGYATSLALRFTPSSDA
jgi:GNAT superfamily N-acetyltransferase